LGGFTLGDSQAFLLFSSLLFLDVVFSSSSSSMIILLTHHHIPFFSSLVSFFLSSSQFTAYLKKSREDEQEAARLDAVFPCVLQIMPTCIFNKKDPIVLGVEVVDGIAKIGTPLCIPSQGGIDLGRIASMEKDHKAVDTAVKGDSIAMKIESTKAEEAARLYGRHFDFNDKLVSRISRRSIDVLKDLFRDEMGKEDWRLVVQLKKVFRID
jgi:translation initiation factor 5B